MYLKTAALRVLWPPAVVVWLTIRFGWRKVNPNAKQSRQSPAQKISKRMTTESFKGQGSTKPPNNYKRVHNYKLRRNAGEATNRKMWVDAAHKTAKLSPKLFCQFISPGV